MRLLLGYSVACSGITQGHQSPPEHKFEGNRGTKGSKWVQDVGNWARISLRRGPQRRRFYKQMAWI